MYHSRVRTAWLILSYERIHVKIIALVYTYLKSDACKFGLINLMREAALNPKA
jgi:hypothetical protein